MKLKFSVLTPNKKEVVVGTLTLDPNYTLCQQTINLAIIELQKLGYSNVRFLGHTN